MLAAGFLNDAETSCLVRLAKGLRQFDWLVLLSLRAKNPAFALRRERRNKIGLKSPRFFIQQVIWCPGAESNHRHEDFQSTALPLSYPGAGTTLSSGSGVLGDVCEGVQRHLSEISGVFRGQAIRRHRPVPLARPGSRRRRSTTLPDRYPRSGANKTGGISGRYRDCRSDRSFGEPYPGQPLAFTLQLEQPHRRPADQRCFNGISTESGPK